MPYRNAKWAKLVSNFAHFADQFRPICFLVGQKDIKVCGHKDILLRQKDRKVCGHKDIKFYGTKRQKDHFLYEFICHFFKS